MKKIFIVLFLFFSVVASAATYYVSPTGSDISGNGSIGSPWFTLTKAWAAVSAGDVVYMRGGTYYYTSATMIQDKSGTAGSPISILAYPGEKPIINGGHINPLSYSVYALVYFRNCNWIYMKGIRICNLPQPNPIANSSGYYGISMGNYDPSSAVWVTNITFEQIEIDHIGGWGCTIFEHCTDITWLNCDSHHHQDPYSNLFGGDNYGGSDGWESAAETSTRIHFIGCRSWWNSDDGWDNRYATGLFTYDHCWAFRNGYIPNTYTLVGNGEGFKLQGTNSNQAATTNIRRIVQNCLSFDNQAGYEGVPEANYVGMQIYNNVAFRTVGALNFQGSAASTTILRNNIILNYSWATVESQFANDHNSWNSGIATVTNADFYSTDTTGVTGARQSDGSLPSLNFLKLVSGSDCRGKGLAISGLTTDGAGNVWNNPPSIGAYEYTSGLSIPLVTTTSITGVTTTGATSGGNVSSDGGATVTTRGICWSTSSNPSISGSHTTDGSGTGSFTSTLSGLFGNTLYHVSAYATNSQGTAYGSDISFTTASSYTIPTVTTTAITGIATTSATGGGNVTADGGTTVTAKGVCWGTSSNPTVSGNHTTDGTGTGTYSSTLSVLTPGTNYYVRAYATNSQGTAYGSNVQFTSSITTGSYMIKYNGKVVRYNGKILRVVK